MIHQLIEYQLAFGSLLKASSCKLGLPSIISSTHVLNLFQVIASAGNLYSINPSHSKRYDLCILLFTLLCSVTRLMPMWLWSLPSIDEDCTLLESITLLGSVSLSRVLGLRIENICLLGRPLCWTPEGLLLCAQDLRAGFWSCTGRLQLW